MKSFERILGNPLHRWLKFLDKNISAEELKELCDMNQVIRNAEAQLEYLSSDAETIALYRAREAPLHERANMINSTKEEGRSEEKLETARNMLVNGLALPLIIKITGLTEAEIAKLQMEPKDSVH